MRWIYILPIMKQKYVSFFIYRPSTWSYFPIIGDFVRTYHILWYRFIYKSHRISLLIILYIYQGIKSISGLFCCGLRVDKTAAV